MLGYGKGGSSRKSCIIISMTCAGDSTRSSPSINNNCGGREEGVRERVREGKEEEGERREKGGENIYTVTEPLKELQIQTEMAGTCKILYIINYMYILNIH